MRISDWSSDVCSSDLLHRGGQPFRADSLTEDYELGMLIGSYGLSSRFVAALDAGGDPIVSRGAFPKRVEAAVRQKARWTTGISLAGWDHLGWLRPAGTGARAWVAWWRARERAGLNTRH